MLKNLSIYFVRHGETEFNQLQLFQGSSDSPLTAKGIKQAKQTGNALKNIDFNFAYSSPQKRAVDTANYIIANRNINLDFHDGLREISFGNWEQKFVPDYYSNEDFINFEQNAQKYSTLDNKGESFKELLDRSTCVIRDIVDQHYHGNILVVSHGSLLRQLIYVITGGAWQDHLEKTTILGNSSISIVNYQQTDFDAPGIFSIEVLNQIDHLN